MLKVEKPQDLLQHVGEELGPSEWLTVTQEMIDKFVEDNGFRITSEMTMEVEGNARPAMVAETLGIVYA